MGHVINPMEVRVWIQEVQSWLGEMEERYQSAFDIIKEFAGNENLEGKSYNRMKEDFMAYHQLAVHGAGEAKLSIESDMAVLDEEIGTEYLDEDVLDRQIEVQEQICRNYEDVLDRLESLSRAPLLEYFLEPLIERNRKLLELAEKVLEILKEKRERIFNIDNRTRRLFSSASDLFSVISTAISDLQVCVTGKGKMSDGNWKNVLITSFEEKVGKFEGFEGGIESIKILKIAAYMREEDVLVTNGVKPLNAMFERELPEVFARMIYQEMHVHEDGGQTKILWSVVNRIFSEENFTNNKDKKLAIILREGGYEALTHNNSNATYNAFHPDYESEGWENAKRLAASLYLLVENDLAENLNEEYVRNTLAELEDIDGNKLINEIGNADSFWGDGKENHFYVYKEGR